MKRQLLLAMYLYNLTTMSQIDKVIFTMIYDVTLALSLFSLSIYLSISGNYKFDT